MQCTDIFFLKADVCQLGVDQRKVNMLAREYCDAAGIKLKPIILSHHMLYGLFKGQAKMSKSNKESAIFMEDSEEDVERKITNAYCPRVPEAARRRSRRRSRCSWSRTPSRTRASTTCSTSSSARPAPPSTRGGKTYTTSSSVRDAFLSQKL